MTWGPAGRDRTRTAAWRRVRLVILQRDSGICHVCRQPGANEVDHIIPVAEGGTDEATNLAAIHRVCHRKKTGAEATRARARKPGMNRPAEPHPGIR